MKQADIIPTLKAAENELRHFGVAGLYLFGSHARGEAGPISDIDVFVDPKSDEEFGFLEFIGAYEALRHRFGSKIDLGYSTRDGLSKHIRADIERQAIKIF